MPRLSGALPRKLVNNFSFLILFFWEEVDGTLFDLVSSVLVLDEFLFFRSYVFLFYVCISTYSIDFMISNIDSHLCPGPKYKLGKLPYFMYRPFVFLLICHTLLHRFAHAGQGSCCEDICVTALCHTCVIAQMLNEVSQRGNSSLRMRMNIVSVA